MTPEMRYHLRTLLILLAVAPPTIWGTYLWRARSVTAEPIMSPSEFEAEVNSSKVVLHIDVDWSIQAIRSRPVVGQLEQSIAGDPRLSDIRFRRVDCTDQEGALWEAVEHWFLQQPGGRNAVYGGYGAVVWIVDGQIKDCAPDAALAGYDDLWARTQKISKK